MKNRVMSFNDWMITERHRYTYDDGKKIERLLRSLGIEIEDTTVRHYNLIIRGDKATCTRHDFFNLLSLCKKIYEEYPSRIEDYVQEGTFSFRFTFGLRFELDDAFNRFRNIIDTEFGFNKFQMSMSDQTGNLPIKLVRGLYNNMRSSLSPGEEEGLLVADTILESHEDYMRKILTQFGVHIDPNGVKYYEVEYKFPDRLRKDVYGPTTNRFVEEFNDLYDNFPSRLWRDHNVTLGNFVARFGLNADATQFMIALSDKIREVYKTNITPHFDQSMGYMADTKYLYRIFRHMTKEIPSDEMDGISNIADLT